MPTAIPARTVIENQRHVIANCPHCYNTIKHEYVQFSKPETPAEKMPAGEAARTAELATTDLESLTEEEVQRVLGSGPNCRFAYAAGNAAVAAATASASDDVLRITRLNISGPLCLVQ